MQSPEVDTASSGSETPVELRSDSWYSRGNGENFIARSWMRRGLPDDVFEKGKPMIGICNSWSELAPCNLGLRDIAEHVKRGVWEAGGVPFEFPTMSLGEARVRPTSMLFRNLMSMAVEESIRANPIDAVVLLGGCDKTTPAQLMGAASVDLPVIVVSAGPMLNGRYRGEEIGSGTDYWRYSEAVRAGTMTVEELTAAESGMTRSNGVCMTMGTASTMACITEAMGLALPGNGTLPAVDSRRLALAHESGRRIVDLARTGFSLSQVVVPESFHNAVRLVAAIGGSTNAVVHLLALAGRMDLEFTLDDWHRFGATVPLLVDIMPSGRYLMEDFAYAGGVSTVLNELGDLIDSGAPTVGGLSLGELHAGAQRADGSVIRSRANPLRENAGIAVLHGNLAPNGAIIKVSAASDHLQTHTGPALVFDSIEDFKARIDDPALEVTADSVLVLRNCGPKGFPGMGEVGNMAVPAKLLKEGVTDIVRISDARMSGTAFGTVVLHCAPEANVGGPLALVHDGDLISLDVASQSLRLHVDDDELAVRRAAWSPPEREFERGWVRLYIDQVEQADTGVDLAHLRGRSGSVVRRQNH